MSNTDRWIIPFIVDLENGAPQRRRPPQGIMLPGDNRAHTIQVTAYAGREPAALSGTPRGYFIREADGATVICTGSRSGNVASVTMAQACYAYPGPLRCVIRLENSGNPDVTLVDTTFYVEPGTGENIIDPGTPIHNVTELLEHLEDMEEATANARGAVSYIAQAYSTSAIYTEGEYAIHDGRLYRCTATMESAETWTPAHWTQVNFGAELYAMDTSMHHHDLLFPRNGGRVAVAPATSGAITVTVPRYLVRVRDRAAVNIDLGAADNAYTVPDGSALILTGDNTLAVGTLNANSLGNNGNCILLYNDRGVPCGQWGVAGKADKAEVNDLKVYSVTTNGSFATLINASADVNDYTTPGNYRVGSSTVAAQIANLPIARAGKLTVDGLTGQSGNLQKYTTTTGAIYTRVKQNNVWGEWAEIATTGQVEAESSAREAAVSAEATAREADVNTINSDIDHIAGNYVDFSNIGSTSGITFTIVGGEVTATGTAERNIVFPLADITGVSHILYGGCADGGGANTYFLGLYDMDSSGARIDYVLDSGYKLISIDDTKHYRVSLAILSGTTVNNVVFKPFVCTNGLLLDTIIKSNGLSSDAASIGRYRWFNGTCFITVCGNSVFVDMQGLRLYDRKQKTYTAYGVYSSTKLPLTTNTIRYILFDGTNFSLSGEYDDTAIAYSYQMNVVPLIDNIHVNCRPVQDGYIRSNSEYYINYDRMSLDVYGEYTSNDVKTGNRSYIYKSAGTKKYSDAKSIMSFSLTENTTSIANKKILIIGDSFVARGFIQNYLKEFEPSLTFIGTKTTQNYNFKSEGVSGSRLYYFTNPDTSPFYIDGALNFSQYLSNNNLEAPDYVVINSAINHGAFESEYGTYLENLNTLVNMIRAYSATIKIYVTYGANYAMVPGSVYGYPNRRWEAVRTCCNSVYDADNIVVVPINTILIDELDYVYTNYDYFGNTLRILSDCVHPAENTGFKKIATMIYNYLGV